MERKRVAIIGTHGLPARYGGFETLTEFIAEYLNSDFDITVFCSSKRTSKKLRQYNGVKLVYLPFDASGWQSIIYDIVSIIRAVKNFDRILILGASGGIILPFMRKSRGKFIVNIGGLEWKRSKWNYLTRKFLKISEKVAINSCETIISDNKGIYDYIESTYGRKSNLIFYGGDHVFCVRPDPADIIKYPFLNNNYAFSLARIQPDNNISMILDAFVSGSGFPIVFVGNWTNSRYGKYLKEKYFHHPNIILLDSLYENRDLNLLRSNCTVYIHGHSAGGTNPALVEAMFLGLPVYAYSNDFNYYTTGGKASYFKSIEELKSIILKSDQLVLKETGEKMKEIATRLYTWQSITNRYAEIFNQPNNDK